MKKIDICLAWLQILLAPGLLAAHILYGDEGYWIVMIASVPLSFLASIYFLIRLSYFSSKGDTPEIRLILWKFLIAFIWFAFAFPYVYHMLKHALDNFGMPI